MLLILVSQLVNSPERVPEHEWSEEEQIRSDLPQAFPREQSHGAKLRPQMELASQNARKAAEQMQKTFCDQQRKVTAKAKVEAEKQARQFKREQEKLQRELERMSQEMRKNWLNI